MQIVDSPLPQFFEADGSPLDDGYVYIGVAGSNPETSPLQVYWDTAGTQPAAQPLRTTAGWISRTGTPSPIASASASYSMTVRDKRGRLVFSALYLTGRINVSAYISGLLDDPDAATARATLGAPAADNGVHTGTTTMQTVAAQTISAAVAATVPTRAQADNGTDVATTAFVQAARLSKILTIDGTVAANALTITLQPCVLDFRSSTLSSGAVNARTVPSALSLVVPSSATLGTINAQTSRIVVLAIDNAGTVELACVNLSGGVQLTEAGTLNTTTISAGATSASTVYSTTGRTGVAYRVVGYIESTQATAGTWASAPNLVQGVGGQALVPLNTLGGGQTWQNVTGSRAFATTYYNTTGRPIEVFISGTASANSMTFSVSVDGTVIGYQGAYQSGNQSGVTFVVPPGKSYSAAAILNCTLGSWFELR